MEDQDIIDLFFERSEQAVRELIRKYGTAIQKVASNILADPLDVEECCNDTYMALWNQIPPARPTYLGAYACRVARNISLNRYHASTAEKRNSYYDVALDELGETVSGLSDIESEHDAKELAKYLNLFLGKQSREDRYLFMRRYWYGDKLSDIAQMLGITPHKASVRLFRLRQKLREYLMKEGMIV